MSLENGTDRFKRIEKECDSEIIKLVPIFINELQKRSSLNPNYTTFYIHVRLSEKCYMYNNKFIDACNKELKKYYWCTDEYRVVSPIIMKK